MRPTSLTAWYQKLCGWRSEINEATKARGGRGIPGSTSILTSCRLMFCPKRSPITSIRSTICSSLSGRLFFLIVSHACSETIVLPSKLELTRDEGRPLLPFGPDSKFDV